MPRSDCPTCADARSSSASTPPTGVRSAATSWDSSTRSSPNSSGTAPSCSASRWTASGATGVRGGAPAPLPAVVRLRAERRGLARLQRLPQARRLLGARALRDRRRRSGPLELSLAHRREPGRRRRPGRARGAAVAGPHGSIVMSSYRPIGPYDHTFGPPDAPYQLVEYGDY